MLRRTLQISLIALGLALLTGACAQAGPLPAGAAIQFPLNAEKVIPPAGMTIGLELFRVLPDGTLHGPIASWDTGQPTRPTVLDCMAVRVRVFMAANSVKAVKVADDKYGRELEARKRSRAEGRAEERAQYAENQPNVGWNRMLAPPLNDGLLSLDATVWSKDVMNQYMVGRRGEERKTYGQALAAVKQSPPSWNGVPPTSYTDEDLVRGFMKGWEYLGPEEMDPAYIASKLAQAQMRTQLAAAAGQVPASPVQPVVAPAPPAPKAPQAPQARQVQLRLQNGRYLQVINFKMTATVETGDTLVFITDGKAIARATVQDVKGDVISAKMTSGVGRDVSRVQIGIARSGS